MQQAETAEQADLRAVLGIRAEAIAVDEGELGAGYLPTDLPGEAHVSDLVEQDVVAAAQIETEGLTGVDPPRQHDRRIGAGFVALAAEILVEGAPLGDFQRRDLDRDAGLFFRGLAGRFGVLGPVGRFVRRSVGQDDGVTGPG